MNAYQKAALTLAAEAFCYPIPGRLERLRSGLEALPGDRDRHGISRFLKQVGAMPLSEWEELYTRTLDLAPPAAPYIGFQVWGESYQRGLFLSKMNQQLMFYEVESEGELPDHIIPVLRYLSQVENPIPELLEALDPAFQRMISALRKADSKNPYLTLLEGAQMLCNELSKEAA